MKFEASHGLIVICVSFYVCDEESKITLKSIIVLFELSAHSNYIGQQIPLLMKWKSHTFHKQV